MTIFLTQKRTKGYENKIIFIKLLGTLLNSNKFHPLKKSPLHNVDTFKKHLQIKYNFTFRQSGNVYNTAYKEPKSKNKIPIFNSSNLLK